MKEQLEILERNWGGARKGAGFPKGRKARKTLIKEKAQAYLTRRIEEAIEPLTNALIDKALEKDMPAIKEAFERGLGKVKDVHQLEGELTINGVNISLRE